METLIARYLSIHGLQARSTREELGRLRDLLDAAGAQLMSSFGTIQAWTELHRSTAPGSEPERTDAMAQAIREAVGAMQFHDLTSQLLEHILGRITFIERISEVIGRRPVASTEALEAMVTEWSGAQRPNPVAQSSMEGGSAELF